MVFVFRSQTSASPTALTPGLLAVLALLSAIAPLATDLYLPAFPDMAADLATTATGVQLTLTSFLLGVAIGQLLFGPLSDRLGRLVPLLWGISICVVSSAVAALAPNIEVLVIARFIQGLSGAAGMVIGRAVIADLATGRSAARAFSVVMMVGGVAPIVAPLLGSMLLEPFGWRGILWVVAGLALVMLAATLASVRETHPPLRRARIRRERALNGSAARDLRSSGFVGNAIAFAFSFSAMMAYIAASPFVYQVLIGMDAPAYGVTFGITALGLLLVSALSARLTRRFSLRSLLSTGIAVLVVSSAAVLVCAIVSAPSWTLIVSILVAVASLGLILGNATALALDAAPRAAGTGSAVLGALQFGVGAIVSPLVGAGGEHTAVPLGVVMLACAVIAAVGLVTSVLGRRDSRGRSR
ncbi:MAG TPA: multidrug effflux MFS transporter [Microbacterium sp.]|nr:multidrug effflux MFS transporter [Microbacterium sp.]